MPNDKSVSQTTDFVAWWRTRDHPAYQREADVFVSIGILRDAVAEMERLRALLARYREETPLGHQPHMIAHEVDKALGR